MEAATYCKEPVASSAPIIKGTWFRRQLTILATRHLWCIAKRRSSVLFLPFNICIKASRLTRLDEAAAMRFVAANCRVPVPKVHCAFKRKEVTYIVMEKVDGEMLGCGWTSRSEDSRTKILSQLRAMIADLRSIPAPSNGQMASISGGELYDMRLPAENARRGCIGPFEDVAAFHRYLRREVEEHPDHFPGINEMIASQNAGNWPVVFTHGDLSSLNILVRGDEITGIVDWETAGWWPSYWEYTTAHNVNFRNEFWREEIDKFLEPMPKELAMEQTRNRYFGDV